MGYFKRFFKGWNVFEYVFLTAGIIIPVVIGVVCKSQLLEIFANVFMITVTLLFAKAKIEAYFLSFISLTLYVVVAYKALLYGEVIVYLALILPVTVYGLINWMKNKFSDNRKGQVVKIIRTRWVELLVLFGSQAVLGVGYYFLLRALHTNLLLISTFSLALSFVAVYLVARRSEIALLGWVVEDFLVLALWITVIAKGSTDSAVMIVMACMNIISDSYGVFMWRRLKKSQSNPKSVTCDVV